MSIRPAKALIALVVGAFLLWALVFRAGPQLQSIGGATMGTSWSLQLRTEAGSRELENLADELKGRLETLDKGVFSTYAYSSELSRLNRAPAGQALTVSADMQRVLLAARELYRQSGGAFDPSVGPLVELWGFGARGAEEESGVPGEQQLAAARAALGMDRLELYPQAGTLRKRGELSLDLSAIAKGYAVDVLAELLLARGYTDFLLEIGGELRLQGRPAEDRNWSVAVEKPLPDAREAQALLDSRGEPLALAGSGSYRNFREVDGRRYSHEIDPRSGYPVEHRLAAVTVLADSAMLADGWATALMVLGPEEGGALADRLGIGAYFIMYDGEDLATAYNAGIARYLREAGPAGH